MPVIVGIDPGLNGAIAIFDTTERGLVLHDMPTVELKKGGRAKRETAPAAVAALLGGQIVDHAYLEHVWARQGEAASSSFTFGECYGVLRGALAAIGIPYTLVAPITWQKAMGVRDGKDGGRARAMEAFPGHAGEFKRKADSGKADAALIAAYGCKVGGWNGKP